MRVLVLGGAGDMGSHVVEEISKDKDVEKIIIGDINFVRASQIAKKYGKDKFEILEINANKSELIIQAMKNADVSIGCIGPFYKYEREMVKAAISAKKTLCEYL